MPKEAKVAVTPGAWDKPGIGNPLRIFLARLVIAVIDHIWRAGQRVLSTRFTVSEHYYMMKIFRTFGSSYPVAVTCRNPIGLEAQDIQLQLDLCENSQNQYFRAKASGGIGRIQLISHELPWIRLIGKAMGQAGTFVDVGAHIGIYTLTTAQAFPHQRVIAIEPRLANFSKLSNHVAANGLANVQLIHAAVTESREPVRFYDNPLNDGGGSIIQPIAYRTGDVMLEAADYRRKNPGFEPWTQVNSLRLDDIITGSTVLKIDVEGAEVQVLMSGVNSLQRQLVDLIVVEVTPDSIEQVVTFLTQLDFECHLYGLKEPIVNSTQVFASFSREQQNILCLRKGANLSETISGWEASPAEAGSPGVRPPTPGSPPWI